MREDAIRVWNGDAYVDESPMTPEQIQEALSDMSPIYSIIQLLEC